MSFFHRHHHIDPVEELLEDVVILLKQIRDSLRPQKVVAFIIRQIGESPMPTQEPVIGIPVGGTGTFLGTPVDSSGNAVALPAGILATWSSTSQSVTLTVSADTLTVTAAASSTIDTTIEPNFTLSINALLADGTPVSGRVTMALIPATPSAPPSSFVITQLS